MDAVELCRSLMARAAAEGRTSLLEHEGLELLGALGLSPPRHVFLPEGRLDPAALAAVPGERLVIKVVSPQIAHKTEVGGVRRVARGDVPPVLEEMRTSVPRRQAEHGPAEIRGFLLVEEIPHRAEPGHEVLVGARYTEGFGPVVVLGTGGVHSEAWARALGGGRGIAMRVAEASRASLRAMLDQTFVGDFLLGRTRTGEALCGAEEVVEALACFAELAKRCSPLDPQARHHVLELEVNPFVVSDGRLRPLDVLLRFKEAGSAVPQPRPQAALRRMLRPNTVAIAGVSEKGQNIGRIILGNLLRDQFPRERIYIVKPGAREIEGCKCYESVAALPEEVDLYVVATPAPQVPEIVEEIERGGRVAGVLLIPGGIGEKQGSESIESRITRTIRGARSQGAGTVYAGSNSLGLVSAPGRYDTMFIPGYKLPPSRSSLANTAIVSQSGAFIISRLSKQPYLRPRYALSIGNQIDLTFSDYLRALRDDPAAEVVALYIEGFRPLDGLATTREIAALVDAGRDVLVYKAGRTAAGRSSSAGHTASIAGDYSVAAAMLREAGAWVADTFLEFENATKLLAFLHSKVVRGRRVGGISNAGFESVGMADNTEATAPPLTLPALAPATIATVRDVLARSKLGEIVDPRNPLDVTPVTDDASFAEHATALLGDPSVDAAVVSVVPLTAALNTLPAQPEVHRDDVEKPEGLARRLVEVARKTDKPFVVTVDSGRTYDRFADIFEEASIPVFREADTAMRLLAAFIDLRLRRADRRA